MLKFQPFVLIALFTLPFQMLRAQQTLNDCGNLGVEKGTFEGWEGQYGTWAADYANNSIFYLTQNIGFEPESHRIRKVSDGNIPDISSVQIPFVPPGSQYAIQLGNSIKGGEYEQLRTSFKVDSNNSLFQYRFAVIFEDPGHLEIEQPRFELIVTDQTGSVIPCGFYRVTSANNIDGFQSEGKIRFRDWTTAAVDLRDYIGEIVTVTISTYDCSKGGHWGMALFDAACFEAKIQSFNHCPGIDSVITLAAPEGFQQYLWSNGASGRVIEVAATGAGQELSVTFSPYSSLHDSCRLTLKYEVPGTSDLLKLAEMKLCENARLQLKSGLEGNQFSYLWMPGGETTDAIQVSKPGIYTLQATKGNCVVSDTVEVKQIPGPQVVLLAENPACDGKNDGYIKTQILGNEPVSYLWSTQSTAAELLSLASGMYKVTVTGKETGCVSHAEKLLVQDAQVFADAEVVQTPLCSNWPEGKALVKAKSGVPPYQYAWSTGSKTEETTLVAAGQYRVTVTDSEGCQAVDIITVKPLRAGLETEGNICHDGRNGRIEISAFDGQPPYHFALGNNPYGKQAEFEGLPTGVYMVHVMDQSGCIRDYEAKIENLLPQAFEVKLPKDTSVVLGTELAIVAQPNYPLSEISWVTEMEHSQTDSLSLLLQPLKTGRVQVRAVDENGCTAQDEMLLIVLKDYKLYIPNVFEPSAAEGNSRFYFSAGGNQIKDVVRCQIFDRWGTMVFEDFEFEPNNPMGGWDGRRGGEELSPGVYAYRLEIAFIDGETRVFFGDVTLVR